MPQIESAKKRIRQDRVRSSRNRARRSRVHTFSRLVNLAIENGSVDEAKKAMQHACSEIHRAVSKHALHRNTAARKLSRMNARIKKLASA